MPEETFRELARAWSKVAEGLTEVFAKAAAAFAADDQDAPSAKLHGPRPRGHQAQHRAPRHHRTNTTLTAHNRQRPAPPSARHRGYRTGGAGR